jgi:hypothetical protein
VLSICLGPRSGEHAIRPDPSLLYDRVSHFIDCAEIVSEGVVGPVSLGPQTLIGLIPLGVGLPLFERD